VQALVSAAEDAVARHRQENAERQQALTAVRREVLALRELAAEVPVRQQENEQLIGENAALAADLANALEELQIAHEEFEVFRCAAEEAELHQFEEDAERQKALTGMRAEVARLLSNVSALEERASQCQTLEARLQEAWVVTTRLEGELALACASRNDLANRLAASQAPTEQLEALRAERDTLAAQVKALQADLAHQPGQEGALFKNAIEAAFAEVVKPKGEASSNENVARALAEPQRSAASNEVARLKQENAQLRQWLAQCGVLPM
jgi:hypothetical protein